MPAQSHRETLVEAGFVEKEQPGRRTNSYELTPSTRAMVRDRVQRLASAFDVEASPAGVSRRSKTAVSVPTAPTQPTGDVGLEAPALGQGSGRVVRCPHDSMYVLLD
jgi:hypothetical protein